MADMLPLRRGLVLLVVALNARGWTQYRLAKELDCKFPVVGRVLRRRRGVGLDLASRINKALDGAVPLDAWSQEPSSDELAAFEPAYQALLARGQQRLQSAPPVAEAP